LLVVDIDKKEAGKLIGREAQMVLALRCIFRGIAAKNKARIGLKINTIYE
jgi:predicted RNA-binding protein YlqC (UPF0109 family)